MSKKKPFKVFLEEAIKKHGKKFTYDENTYKDSHTKMRIICSKHGEFWRTPKSHLLYDCKKCSYEKRSTAFRKTIEQFITDAEKVHGNKYDYSNVEYTKAKEKVCIICPEHGEFYQKPNDHLSGKGCPRCNNSHLERIVSTFLKENNINFIYQYKNNFLKKQSLDFYLPEYNIGIECQGKQHFGFGGWSKKYDFKKISSLDERKYNLCMKNGMKLIYIIPNNINPYHNNIGILKENFIKIKNLETIKQWLIKENS